MAIKMEYRKEFDLATPEGRENFRKDLAKLGTIIEKLGGEPNERISKESSRDRCSSA
jgi:hypothetical protein